MENKKIMDLARDVMLNNPKSEDFEPLANLIGMYNDILDLPMEDKIYALRAIALHSGLNSYAEKALDDIEKQVPKILEQNIGVSIDSLAATYLAGEIKYCRNKTVRIKATKLLEDLIPLISNWKYQIHAENMLEEYKSND
ncbi:MAG: hypothetical protein V1815_00660 [Candidatus Woesearchaeota archaeon]